MLTNKIVSSEWKKHSWFHIREHNTISYTRIILVSHAKSIKIYKKEGFFL